jgi:anti-anti-sigma regulatory factor
MPAPRASRVVLEITGTVDGSRRPGFFTLVDRLVEWGLDDILVSVEKADSVDSSGASSLIEMLGRLRRSGLRAHLAVGSKGLRALLAAARVGGAPLRSSVHHWMDISDSLDLSEIRGAATLVAAGPTPYNTN